MENEILWDLLAKFLNDECSADEKRDVFTWFNSHPSHPRIFMELKETWILSQGIQTDFQPDLKTAWQKVDSRIENAKNRSINKKEHSRLYFPPALWKIAAMFVIGVSLYLFYNQYRSVKNSDTFEITNSIKEIEKIYLPDGSQVWLNKGSKIRYSKNFSESLRSVSLNGEPFFDVFKDSSRPFIVDARKTQIRVLGTSFTYRSIPGEESDIIIVNSGKVSFFEKENNINSAIIESGFKADFDYKSRYITKALNQDENYFAWKTGRLIFEDEKFDRIVTELSKYYKRKFIIEDNQLNEIRFTMTFDNQPIEEVLKILAMVSDRKFVDTSSVIFVH